MAMNKKGMFVVLGYVLLLAALGVTLDGSLALLAIDRLAQSERYTNEMDKLPAALERGGDHELDQRVR
jgi:hypothetical protein